MTERLVNGKPAWQEIAARNPTPPALGYRGEARGDSCPEQLRRSPPQGQSHPVRSGSRQPRELRPEVSP